MLQAYEVEVEPFNKPFDIVVVGYTDEELEEAIRRRPGDGSEYDACK